MGSQACLFFSKPPIRYHVELTSPGLGSNIMHDDSTIDCFAFPLLGSVSKTDANSYDACPASIQTVAERNGSKGKQKGGDNQQSEFPGSLPSDYEPSSMLPVFG